MTHPISEPSEAVQLPRFALMNTRSIGRPPPLPT
jgi:hypothetical protein